MDTHLPALLLTLLNELVARASVHRRGPEYDLMIEIAASFDALLEHHDLDYLRDHLTNTTYAILGNQQRQTEPASRFATEN